MDAINNILLIFILYIFQIYYTNPELTITHVPLIASPAGSFQQESHSIGTDA
jgi:hypothetical protein